MLKSDLFFFTFISIILLTSCTDNGSYQTSPNGLQYKIIVDNKKEKARPGEYISYHVFWRTLKDSLLFSSENVNQPLVSLVARPLYKGDLWEVFTFLGAGDSASCQVPARNIFKTYLPSNMKPDDLMKVDFKVLGVLSQKQVDSLQTARANAQVGREDQELQTYMRKNGYTATRTPSGLYVMIEKEGTGKQAERGDIVKVDYTGRFLDGTMFDSSVGKQPYQFKLGVGSVIQGWDEGLTYFKQGGKGKLFIPSKLAYGEAGFPPKIGPNLPLMFDVEMVEIKKP